MFLFNFKLLSVFLHTHTLTFLCVISVAEDLCARMEENEKKKSLLGDNKEIRSDSEQPELSVCL